MSRIALLALCSFCCASAHLRAQEDPEPKPQTPNSRGVSAYEQADYVAAIDWFEKALEERPESKPVRGNLARALHANSGAQIKAGKLIEATQALERAVALDPLEPRFAVRLSQVWERRDDRPAARRALVLARERTPKSPEVFEALGRLEYAEERLNQALLDLNRAIELHEEAPRPLVSFRDKVKRELEVEGDWFTDSRGQFTVKYDDQGFQSVGTAVLTMLDRAYQDIGQHLDHWPRKRVNVVLYSRRDYDSATGAHAWTGGLYDGKIRIPVRNFQRARNSINETVRHEMTHWFVRDLCPRCPLWFHEGLAQLMEGKRFGAAEKARLKAQGALPSVLKLPPSWAGIQDAKRVRKLYLHSLGFTAFLDRRYGGTVMRDVMAAINKGAKFEAAIEAVTREPLARLERAFAESL